VSDAARRAVSGARTTAATAAAAVSDDEACRAAAAEDAEPRGLVGAVATPRQRQASRQEQAGCTYCAHSRRRLPAFGKRVVSSGAGSYGSWFMPRVL